MEKKVWSVVVPIAGHVCKTVEADTEEEAIQEAIATATLEDIESWDALKRFNQGNVCYCPSPWEAEATDETPDEE